MLLENAGTQLLHLPSLSGPFVLTWIPFAGLEPGSGIRSHRTQKGVLQLGLPGRKRGMPLLRRGLGLAALPALPPHPARCRPANAASFTVQQTSKRAGSCQQAELEIDLQIPSRWHHKLPAAHQSSAAQLCMLHECAAAARKCPK